MLKFDTVTKIIYNIKNTDKTFSEISNELGVSYVTISNINRGKTHKREELVYPLRTTKTNFIEGDNFKHFCNYLYDLDYTIKQIHIICGEGSYSTISRYITHGKKELYKPSVYLEERKRTFDIISTPNEKMINKIYSELIVEDLVYIKFLSRMRNCSLEDIIYIYLPIVDFETIVWEYPLRTKEDIAKYLDWGGGKSKIIQIIKHAFNNKIYRIKGESFFYNDISIEKLANLGDNLDKDIIKDLIEFQTKEEHIKR